jgi:YD repeat-containing protein
VNRVAKICDALNSKTKLTYNDAGLVDSVFYQLGAGFSESTAIGVSYAYNSVDRLTSVTDSLGRITQFTLDDNDNVAAAADPQGYVSEYSTGYGYNALDLIESITLPEDYDTAEGNQNVTAIDYTVDGLINTATDAEGNTTEYYYDIYRRLYKFTEKLLRSPCRSCCP